MKLLYPLICLAGISGWVMAFTDKPKELPVTVMATPESLEHARQVCNSYRERTGGVVGHVNVYSIVGEWSAVPCAVIISEGK